jgi:signal peptidase I
MSMPATLTRLLDGKLRGARKLARVRLREARKLSKRSRGKIPEALAADVAAAMAALEEARSGDDIAAMRKQGDKLGALCDRHLAVFRKAAWRESFESVAIAVLVALLLRSFVVEAFKIPSGSMIPTLAIGDQIFVNKYIYGVRVPFTAKRIVDFSMPKRGEVVVFICPVPPNEDYIKRVIGLPGDEIVVRHNTLYVNGKPEQREALGKTTEIDRDTSGPWHTFDANAFKETLGEHTYTVLQDVNVRPGTNDYGPYIVPEGHVFVMGDNRDHSFDSRAWGPVPLSNILGRSMFVWWSWGRDGLNSARLGTWIN